MCVTFSIVQLQLKEEISRREDLDEKLCGEILLLTQEKQTLTDELSKYFGHLF
jgi:hypothetical protein